MDTKYLKNVLVYILSALLAIGAIYYVLYHVFDGFSSSISTSVASLVTERETENGTAYIFRDEKIVYSDYSGAVNYLVDDGERVRVNTEVAKVYQSGDGNSIRARLDELDRRLALLRASNIEKNVVVSGTAKIDSEIQSLYLSAVSSAGSGEFSYALHVKDDMLSKLNRRAIIVGDAKNYDTQIAAVLAERAALTSLLDGSYESISTQSSGYFFYGTDGYENKYRAAELESLSLSELTSLFSEKAEADEAKMIGKLVEGHTWYIAVPTTDGSHADYTVGDRYNVSFPYNYNTTLNMTLERIVSETGNDNAVLVFSTTEMPVGFSYARSQSVTIEKSIVTGYSIPTSALRMVDGKEGVYILYGSTVYFRLVDVIYESDGYFIVKERDPVSKDADKYLGPSDVVISRGKELYDGKIIG